MSERIYIPPRRHRQLPIDSASSTIAWLIIVAFVIGVLVWYVRSH